MSVERSAVLPIGVQCNHYNWSEDDCEAEEDTVGPGERLVVIHRWPVDHCGECKTPCGRGEETVSIN